MQPNRELQTLFEADQADRQGELNPEILQRDRQRRERVEQLLAEGAFGAAEDYLHAAFIFQHGDKLEHYWQAHELAMQAVELGHQHLARWLSAASYDRWLMHQGLPQKFGTQYRLAGERWVLHAVDPATTDAERARWNVPTFAEAHQHADTLNGEQTPATSGEPAAQQLAQLAVPGLQVVVIALEAAMALPGNMPPLELFGPADEHEPVPSYLPPGLRPAHIGQGYCAVDSDEEIVVTWFNLALPPGEPMVFAWRTTDGPTPTLVAVDLGDRRTAVWVSATWSSVALDTPPVIVLRSGIDSCWLVGGHLSREELALVVASLPE